MGTLADSLAEAFDEVTCEAWCEMYGLVSSTMLAAADAHQAMAV